MPKIASGRQPKGYLYCTDNSLYSFQEKKFLFCKSIVLILKEYTEDEWLYCHGFIINTYDIIITQFSTIVHILERCAYCEDFDFLLNEVEVQLVEYFEEFDLTKTPKSPNTMLTQLIQENGIYAHF